MAALEQYSQVIVSVAMIAVVSRLLSSSEIGIAVIGLGIGTIAFNFREFVTSEYLIQREDVDRDQVRAAYTLMFGSSFAIACLLIVLAPWLSNFYGEPKLKTFILLLAVAGVIDSSISTISAVLKRDMQFGTLTRVNALATLSHALVTIFLAWHGFGFMSFAWGVLISSLIRLVLGFHARPFIWMYRPCFSGWRPFFTFGGFKGASTVLDRIYESLPQLVLGRMMPLAAVGLYNRANIVCGLPDKVLLSATFSVAFPAFSAEVRAERCVRAAYLRIISYIAVLYWPAQLVLAILAYPIVHLALGPAWDEAVPLVRFLSVASVLWFPNILTYPVLMALGANKDAFESNLIGRGISTVIIVTASFFGLYGLILSQFIILPFQSTLSFIYVRRHVHFDWSELWAIMFKSAKVTLCACAGPLLIAALEGFRFDQSLLLAIASAILSAIGWVAALVVTKHPFLDELSRFAGFLPRLPLFKYVIPAK